MTPDMRDKPVNVLFPEKVKQVEGGICPTCNKTVDLAGFRDELSATEYGISGLCQKCQDKMWPSL